MPVSAHDSKPPIAATSQKHPASGARKKAIRPTTIKHQTPSSSNLPIATGVAHPQQETQGRQGPHLPPAPNTQKQQLPHATGLSDYCGF